MNFTSFDSIVTLLPTTKERYSRNRNKNGYNVYVGLYFKDFNELNEDKKMELLCEASIHSYVEYEASDNDSVISRPEASTIDIIKLAARRWNQMENAMKMGWKERAQNINQLPIIGAFDAIPSVLYDGMNKHILASLTIDYDRFNTIIRNAIKKKSRVSDSIKIKRFGKEFVILGSQIFRSFHLNHLLLLTFFGLNFSLLSNDEIVHRTKRTTLIHIASRKRIVEIFSKNDVCPFESVDEKSNMIHTCSGKVVVRSKLSLRECIGYVVDEITLQSKIRVKLETDEILELHVPKYDSEDGSWSYSGNDDIYIIVQYWPIRFKVFHNGQCQMTLNQVSLSQDIS